MSTENSSCLPLGHDEDMLYVRYAENVADGEKVPGLTAFLEKEYEKIYAFAVCLFGKEITMPCRLPVVLSTEKPIRTYSNTDVNYSDMKSLGSKTDVAVDMDFPMLGNYYHKGAPFELPEMFSFADGGQPYVELYYRNVSFADGEEYRAKLVQSFAHEFFHVVHEAYTPTTFVENPRTAVGTGVKEAISDFFSVMYLAFSHEPSDKKAAFAEERYRLWKEYLGSAWPYANAAWFNYTDGQWNTFEANFDILTENGCLKKYKEVFFISREGLNAANEKMKR